MRKMTYALAFGCALLFGCQDKKEAARQKAEETAASEQRTEIAAGVSLVAKHGAIADWQTIIPGDTYSATYSIDVESAIVTTTAPIAVVAPVLDIARRD